MNVYGLRQDFKGAYVAVIMKIFRKLKKRQRTSRLWRRKTII